MLDTGIANQVRGGPGGAGVILIDCPWYSCRPNQTQILQHTKEMSISLILIQGRCPKKRFFFGRPFPNLSTFPPTQGFLWDLGKQKVKFLSKKSDFRGDLGVFWGVWTFFGNQAPHPPTFGKVLPKKNVLFLHLPSCKNETNVSLYL